MIIIELHLNSETNETKIPIVGPTRNKKLYFMSVCVYRNIGSVCILSDKYAAYTQKRVMLKLNTKVRPTSYSVL